ncbi:uncharacterized protein BDZ99DRAFT_576220 [Mytilinidion resinicola]|uniref:BTB domain-containing protein n=1 Tax=Mytilinidion resinicola TaxID=574789 RepID=A0A6A6Y689_9PEZI|nr:uncharacterized protein BDZ99DRAFT_576220 [Mytilinidion resinicola]KAF2803317.1 hypothetical protein BDZ99DRAFT_576220 [Mytilinidion resinicola]
MPAVTRQSTNSSSAANRVAKPKLKDPRERRTRKLAHFGRTMVQVCVGQDDRKEVFSVHDTPLRSHSKFFANALKGPWKESKERLVKLPEDDPELFSIYMHYIYCGTLAILAENMEADIKEFCNQFATLAHLYVFAEKIQDTACKNNVIDAMLASVRVKNKLPPTRIVCIIYSGTAGPCSARKLLVDLCARWAKESYYKNPRQDKLPADFLVDVIDKMIEYRGLPRGNAAGFEDGSRYYDTTETMDGDNANENGEGRA